MQFIFILVSVMSCGSLIPSIRFNINFDGQLVIPNGIIPGRLVNATEFYLTISGSSTIHTNNENSRDLATFLYTSEDVILCPLRYPDCWIRRTPYNTTSVTVAVGPGSWLIREHGAISVLKHAQHSGSLMLGDTEGNTFNRSCVPDSTFHFPITSTSSLWTLQIRYRLTFPRQGSSRTPREFQLTTRDIPSGLNGNQNIFTLPFSFATEIARKIMSLGGRVVRNVVDSTPNQFSNCSKEHMIDQLPKIFLIFSNNDELAYYPEDYMKFDELISQCKFKFLIESINTRFFGFNPLLIPNVNAHITSSEIRLCDSLVF